MTVIKCKMCGGNIVRSANNAYGMCDSCGSTMTLPKIDDEQRAAAFNRGNHFRRIGEFDKALTVYESIVREDDSDAEAHWCCALCRFGIEYVEDPATYEWLPTCHRASFDSFLEDVDYLAALEHSDGITRRQYQKDGAKIAEVQRGILATSQNEEPFDVFICYKESDENGQRTRDSLLAQEIYYQLTEQGRRVFFSRITLEDKAGTEYEPYIFAALNSAKVMVAVGTKPEHFNAVWVKNEWSRFLALMRKDRSRLLLPCYRDMDPYDLPEQLSVLQSYDMAKIGFIQDLTRGISKVLDADKPEAAPAPVKETVVVQQAAGGNIQALLDRGNMALEDGQWEKADGFFEEVLNQNAKCAEAYLGKLMAELRTRNQAALKNQPEPFDESNNYQKTLRFADEKLKATLTGYIEHINTRNEEARLASIYSRAKNVMSHATTEDIFKEAARLFDAVREYKDAETLAKTCYEKAEDARKDTILASGKSKMGGKTIYDYESAIKLFESIPNWQDADEQIIVCQKKIEEIKAKEEAERIEHEHREEIARKEEARRTKRNKKIAIIAAAVVCIVIAFAVLLNTLIIPNGKYNDAIALMEEGKYTEAIAEFENLGGYKDCYDKINECEKRIFDITYDSATVLMSEGKYSEAIATFEMLNGYGDSVEKINECKYIYATRLIDEGDIVEAYELLITLANYKDSAEIASSIQYAYDVHFANAGDCVFFGEYEQDNSISNGKEAIEWLVLEKKDDKLLLVSKYALDCKIFDAQTSIWEGASIRKWLNNEFFNLAFSKEQQEIISASLGAASDLQYTTSHDTTTPDKVFLLSVDEADEYFDSDASRECKPTNYAVANGAHVNSDNGNCWWWLRSPGEYEYVAARVITDGFVNTSGIHVFFDDGTVRPALWIDLS